MKFKLNSAEKKYIKEKLLKDPKLYEWVTDMQVFFATQDPKVKELMLPEFIRDKPSELKRIALKDVSGDAQIRSYFWNDYLYDFLHNAITWGEEGANDTLEELLKIKLLEALLRNFNPISIWYKIAKIKFLGESHKYSAMAVFSERMLYKIEQLALKNSKDKQLKAVIEKAKGNMRERMHIFMEELQKNVESQSLLPSYMAQFSGGILVATVLFLANAFYGEYSTTVNAMFLISFLCICAQQYNRYLENLKTLLDKNIMAKILNIHKDNMEQYAHFRLLVINEDQNNEELILTALPTSRITTNDAYKSISSSQNVEIIDYSQKKNSSHSYLTKELGYTTKQIKELRKQPKPDDGSNSGKLEKESSNNNNAALSWADDLIKFDQVKEVGNGNHEYFCLLNSEELKNKIHDERTWERFSTIAKWPMICGPVDEHGLKEIDYKGASAKFGQITIGNYSDPVPFTHEMKIEGKPRIICAKLLGNDGRSTLYVGCYYLKNGLHNNADVKSFINTQLKIESKEHKQSVLMGPSLRLG